MAKTTLPAKRRSMSAQIERNIEARRKPEAPTKDILETLLGPKRDLKRKRKDDASRERGDRSKM